MFFTTNYTDLCASSGSKSLSPTNKMVLSIAGELRSLLDFSKQAADPDFVTSIDFFLDSILDQAQKKVTKIVINRLITLEEDLSCLEDHNGRLEELLGPFEGEFRASFPSQGEVINFITRAEDLQKTLNKWSRVARSCFNEKCDVGFLQKLLFAGLLSWETYETHTKLPGPFYRYIQNSRPYVDGEGPECNIS